MKTIASDYSPPWRQRVFRTERKSNDERQEAGWRSRLADDRRPCEARELRHANDMQCARAARSVDSGCRLHVRAVRLRIPEPVADRRLRANRDDPFGPPVGTLGCRAAPAPKRLLPSCRRRTQAIG